MVFLILLFFLIFTNPVIATSSVKITDFSSNSDPEWIQLTNTSSENINLTSWSLKDKANNNTSVNICLSPNSTQVIINSSTWLNNTGGDTIYLYDSSQNLIDELSYTTGLDKTQPTNTNTCIIPTPTPTPTTVPANTPTPTLTPTPDPAVTNPTSGITFTEFMPYSEPEWIELYNSNDYPVKLVSWKLEDKDGHTRNVGNNGVLSIGAKSYTVFEYSSFFDNNNAETVILRNQNNTIIGQTSYNAGLRTLDRSWSLISNNYCQSSITKGYENVTSCYTTPTSSSTSTIAPTASPTDRNLYTADESATASAIIDPVSESTTLPLPLSPTVAPIPTISGLVLSDKDSTPVTKNKYLPLIFILVGGCLLASPLILNKIKKK